MVLASLVAAGPRHARAAVLPTLYVNYVSTNCTFTMTTDSGSRVTTIAPGTYQVVIDQSDFSSCTGLPDFQLTGPGVSLETPVDAGTGAAANFKVTFAPSSTYLAQDLTQPVLSRVTFTTQASGAPPAVSLPAGTATGPSTKSSSTDIVGSAARSKSAALPFRGTLAGTVSSNGTPTLSYKGKTVTELVAGKYTVSVVDHSKTGGFIIQEIKKTATTVTGIPFVGKKTVTINLTAGQSFFYPTFVGKKSYFIVVSH
jgi:hypothetical protein